MFKKQSFTALICTLLTVPVYAIEDDTFNAQLSFGWSPLVTLSGGPMWSSPGKYQVINYTDALGNILYSAYNPTNKTSTQGTAELFFALQKEVIPGMAAQLGIQIAGATDSKLQGLTTVNGVASLYNYSYSIYHTRIGLKGKLIALRPLLAQPYLSAGIAASYNQSHLFSSVPRTGFTPYTPWFKNNTVTGFAFSLGAGIQKNLNTHWQVGIGYEFDGLGKSNLGIDAGYPFYSSGTGLRLSNVYAHQLQLSLTYQY